MHEPQYLNAGLQFIQAELKLHILLVHSPLQSLPLPTHPSQDLGLLAPAVQQFSRPGETVGSTVVSLYIQQGRLL